MESPLKGIIAPHTEKGRQCSRGCWLLSLFHKEILAKKSNAAKSREERTQFPSLFLTERFQDPDAAHRAATACPQQWDGPAVAGQCLVHRFMFYVSRKKYWPQKQKLHIFAILIKLEHLPMYILCMMPYLEFRSQILHSIKTVLKDQAR